MVLVAVTLPVLALFVAFAIDVARWYDFSRNLQNRADAAALAGGLEYGGTCFASPPSATAMANIGQIAQNYAGVGANSDIYYPYPVAPAVEQNLPTSVESGNELKDGALGNFHFLINSKNYWQSGGTSRSQSFTMGNPSTVCSSLDEDGNRGPFLDVKVSQADLPLLVPFFGIKPTITAHARVSLEQGTSETNIKPLAVRDDAATPCVSINLVYDSGPNAGQTFKTVQLSQDGTGDPSFPTAVLWDNPAGTSITMPSGTNLSNLYVQPFLNNCAGTGDRYDSGSGVGYLNVYATGNAPANGNKPVITGTNSTTGGVFQTGCSNAPDAYDQYFTSTTPCTVTINANVAFAPNVTPTNNPNTTQAFVNAVDSNDGTSYPLTYQGGTLWSGPGPTITPGDGQHAFTISGTQTAGSINGTTCGTGGKNKPCPWNLGVQQQSFGACNGCGDPNESGPIVMLRSHIAPPTGTRLSSGENAMQAGTAYNLVFEVDVQGLHFDAPGQKATVLRFGVTSDKTTGLIDCGQGQGANADANAITNGCPLYGQPQCAVVDFCAPMKIYNSALHQNGICDPELRETANPAFTDCVKATSGQRRNKIPGTIASLIVKNGTCSPDHWPEYSGSGNPPTYSFPPNDPRAITLIITSPADLSQQNVVVPIRNFATFYVTGWDTKGNNPNCNLPQPGNPPTLPPPAGGYGNEPYPGTGKNNAQNGAIWGHWIIDTDPNAGGEGTFCNPTAFGICTPVLSR